jgi:DNA polymerase-1
MAQGLPTYVLVTQPADLAMVATAVEQSAHVGLDVETTGLDPRRDRIRLLSLACDTVDDGTAVYIVGCFAVDPAPLWELLRDRPIVGHNLLFDLQCLGRMGFVPGDVRDTMLMSQLLHAGAAGLKHSLAAIAERELGITVRKDEQSSDWSGDLTPEQLRYAALDAELPRRLYTALAPKLEAAKLAEVTALEHRVLPAVAWLASSGIAFDGDGWSRLAREADTEAKRLAKELDGLAPPRPQGEMFDPGWRWDSPGDVVAALTAACCPVEGTRDADLAAVDHPLAAKLRDYRAARKLVGAYGANWLSFVTSNGRIHAGWRQLGANSGRMACSKPNLQNLPRNARYRGCFVAPPGRVLVKADYSQIELRIAAKVAGEERMIEAYRNGQDLHTLTARQILGKAEVTKQDRQLAKAVNFGLLYGMGARGFRIYARANYGVELSEDQAQQYRAAFFRTYPALARWHRTVGRSSNQAIETRTLRNRRCLNVVHFNEKLNLPVQGTGADGLKGALALLWERRHQVHGAVPVLVVHDEIVVEVDADRADAVAAWLKQAMLDGMATLVAPVQVEVEISVGRTWAGD